MKPILAAVVLALSAAPAAAICKPRAEIIELIEGKYEESLRARGLASSVQVLELFTNEETGTWTVLTTNPAGISCHLSSGQNWTEYEKGTNL